MKQQVYKTGNHPADHRTFGGIIYASDFNTDCRKNNNASGSAIARRIARDLAFDKECMANAARREML
ncbi:MAG: hypothetical protein HDR26_02515 [Lachnospiraceae bacterium]|nr:hypothetical protein [Lachnospiraceae bacterium]